MVRQQVMEIPPPWTKGKPTRENCDAGNPYEFALWALASQDEMWFPVSYWQLVSRRLWDCGLRCVAKPEKMLSNNPPVWMNRIPTRELCNPDSPWEMALWTLVALPGQKGAPLVREIPCLQKISAWLWSQGFRQVEDPVVVYEPPTGLEPNWTTTAGRWVTHDAAG